jgi:hypothetical protein
MELNYFSPRLYGCWSGFELGNAALKKGGVLAVHRVGGCLQVDIVELNRCAAVWKLSFWPGVVGRMDG